MLMSVLTSKLTDKTAIFVFAGEKEEELLTLMDMIEAGKFFASVLFTYKSFDTDKALSYTAESYGATELECKSF